MTYTSGKLLCYGAACAIGADMLWRYIEERR